MKPVALRAVFFDVGGTLLRPYPSLGAVYARVGKRHGFLASSEKWEQAFRAAWEAAKKTESGSLTTAEKRWWQLLVFHTLETLGLEGDHRVRKKFFEELYVVFARAEAWQLCPGAMEVLRETRARGLHVGAISNWDARLRPLLMDLRLDEQFDSITVSCEVKAEKPAPEIFQAALRTARVLPVEAAHVGDSYEEDVRGAGAVGMRTVLVDPQGGRRSDCAVVVDLDGLFSALD